MPTLPTVTVSAAQATRLLNAFSGKTDANGVAILPQVAYKMWLKETLVGYVRATEANNLRATQQAAVDQLLEEVKNSLDFDPTA